jgi:hypothetical protein
MRCLVQGSGAIRETDERPRHAVAGATELWEGWAQAAPWGRVLNSGLVTLATGCPSWSCPSQLPLHAEP